MRSASRGASAGGMRLCAGSHRWGEYNIHHPSIPPNHPPFTPARCLRRSLRCPRCVRSHVKLRRPPGYMEAELEVGFQMFVER